MAGFTGRYVSSSYQEIVRISGSKFTDGTGSYINAVTLGDVTVTGSLILANLSQVSQSHLLTINPSNGQVYYTSSAAIIPPATVVAVDSTGSGDTASLYSVTPETSNIPITRSISLGRFAGKDSTASQGSIFLGYQAAYNSSISTVNVSYSNVIGYQAGRDAINTCHYSNYIGPFTGQNANGSQISNFIGSSAGASTISCTYSNFIGASSGRLMQNNTNVTIIGTNIALPYYTNNYVNLGGSLFISGTYATTSGDPFSGSVSDSKVGINNSLPNYNLDVSGSGNFTNGLTVSGSFIVSGSISSLESTANGASIAIGTGSVSFQNSIAIGNRTRAGDGSGTNGCIAVGLDVTASGDYNAAFGRAAVASPNDGGAIAAGWDVSATAVGSTAFGRNTEASANFAFACNRNTTASGPASFAAGSGSKALGSGSAAFGLLTIASGSNQFVVGQYNSSNNTSSLFVVGGGSGDVSNRKDIFDVRIDSNYSASIQIPTNPSAPSNPVSGSMYWSGSFIYLYTGAGATGWQSASLS
jgi:hypothetical protein